MGIDKLNLLLQDKYPKCFQYVPWSFFQNKKVAIDIDILTYSIGSIINQKLTNAINFYIEDIDEDKRTELTVSAIIDVLKTKYIKLGVIPIVVFSGVAPQEKNMFARLRRAKTAKTALEKYEEFYNANLPAPGNEKTLPTTIYTKLAKLRAATLKPPRQFDEKLRDALDANGITHLQAIAEAEELCSALCLEGRVHAVYSTDTDNIVRRCPILITDISYRDNGNDIMEMTASVTQYTNELPEALGLDYTGFVDLCILLGCDYNDGIPRWGLVKCFNEMSIHKNIESLIIAFPSIDFSKLNYDRCRQIFNLYHERSSKECCENQDAIDFI